MSQPIRAEVPPTFISNRSMFHEKKKMAPPSLPDTQTLCIYLARLPGPGGRGSEVRGHTSHSREPEMV